MATPNTSSTFLNFNSLQGKFKIKFFVSQNKKPDKIKIPPDLPIEDH